MLEPSLAHRRYLARIHRQGLRREGDDDRESDGSCASIQYVPPYREGTKYNGGEIVSNAGALYRCKSFPQSGGRPDSMGLRTLARYLLAGCMGRLLKIS